jgi:hypothetical protein
LGRRGKCGLGAQQCRGDAGPNASRTAHSSSRLFVFVRRIRLQSPCALRYRDGTDNANFRSHWLSRDADRLVEVERERERWRETLPLAPQCKEGIDNQESYRHTPIRDVDRQTGLDSLSTGVSGLPAAFVRLRYISRIYISTCSSSPMSRAASRSAVADA